MKIKLSKVNYTEMFGWKKLNEVECDLKSISFYQARKMHFRRIVIQG